MNKFDVSYIGVPLDIHVDESLKSGFGVNFHILRTKEVQINIYELVDMRKLENYILSEHENVKKSMFVTDIKNIFPGSNISFYKPSLSNDIELNDRAMKINMKNSMGLVINYEGNIKHYQYVIDVYKEIHPNAPIVIVGNENSSENNIHYQANTTDALNYLVDLLENVINTQE